MAKHEQEDLESTRTACHTTSLNILESLPSWQGVERRQLVEYRPSAQYTDGSVISFECTGLGSHTYIDLASSRVRVKAKIVGPTGADIAEGAHVGPINLTLQSLFSQVDMKIQGVAPSGVGYYFPYKAYMDSIRDPACLLEKYSSQLFVLDDKGQFDTATVDIAATTKNTGFQTRASAFASSKVVELAGNIVNDFAEQALFLISNTTITFKFYPSRPEFLLMAADNSIAYKMRFTDIALDLLHVEIDSKVVVAHSKGLAIKAAEFPYNRSEITIRQLPASSPGTVWGSIFPNEIPSEVIIGIVRSDAFEGDYTKNPFCFGTFGCEVLDLTLDGRSVSPGPFLTDYTGGLYSNAYLSAFPAGGLSSGSFPHGYALFKFDLGNLNTQDCVAAGLGGQLQLRIRLKEPLAYALTVVIYGKRPCIFKIDSERFARVV